MEIKIVKKPISRTELEQIAKEGFGDMTKAVVDVGKNIMAVGGELHMDELETLLEKENSLHQNIWGVNLYPGKSGADFIEFDPMVNLKPAFGNRVRGVDDLEIQKRIIEIIANLIK
jgi:hypothetical protein